MTEMSRIEVRCGRFALHPALDRDSAMMFERLKGRMLKIREKMPPEVVPRTPLENLPLDYRRLHPARLVALPHHEPGRQRS
jgi:hypothetical protein